MSKVWLVTGCSRGLGRATAEAVLEAGDRLVATARSTSDLAFLPAGDRLRTLALDVTDAAAAQAAVKEAVSAFGRLDVVVNNAGFIRANSIEDEPEDEFRRQFEVVGPAHANTKILTEAVNDDPPKGPSPCVTGTDLASSISDAT
jgi:NAD(P)-dependent dehydrogenase (short-subunit alcohol dehydrogenase family)